MKTQDSSFTETAVTNVPKNFDFEKAQECIKEFLEAVGEDPEREGLKETPRRVAKAWAEILQGLQYSNEEIAQMYRKDFHVAYDSMVIKEIDDVYSVCEHHFLPFLGKVYVAYVPEFWNGKDASEGYRVIGLSKIPRIVKMCARRPQLQEKLCADIAECITLATGSDRVYVRSDMLHTCVAMRGVKSEGQTSVTYITPRLRTDVETRKEIESKVQEMHLYSIKA